MSTLPAALLESGPCVIGAIGGSGTRSLARVVMKAGLFIGEERNGAEDSVPFTRFADRWINEFVSRGATSSMERDLERALLEHCAPMSAGLRPWGWKQPRSILLLEYYARRFPNLRFLHLVRDGRDMAFSANQNQLRAHGDGILGAWGDEPEPIRAARMWARVNLTAAELGESLLRDRYRRIRFEDLCSRPTEVVAEVLSFFELAGDPDEVAREVVPPPTIGRFRAAEDGLVSTIEEVTASARRHFGYD